MVGLFSFVSCTTSDQGPNEANQTSSIPSLNASWARGYSSIDELVSDSFVDLIAVGEIDRVIGVTRNKAAENSRGPVYVYFTDFSFRIDSVLKGADTKEVLIHQTGAVGEGEIDQDPLFKPGERYVLFLHEYEPGKYFVTAGPQGRYRIIDDKVYSMNHMLPPKTYFVSEGLDIDGVLESDFIESIVRKIQVDK
jgi:hypothetical protein